MIILVGASATGKTVTALELEKKFGLVKAITTTTRAKRIGEEDGIHYFFLTKEEFEKRAKNNFFVETSLYNNNYYGCGKDQVADNKVVCLDPNGLRSFNKLNDNRIVSFLLICPEKMRKQRMHERGDDDEKIISRLENDKVEFARDKIDKVDFEINTDNKNISEIADIIYSLYKNKLGL